MVLQWIFTGQRGRWSLNAEILFPTVSWMLVLLGVGVEKFLDMDYLFLNYGMVTSSVISNEIECVNSLRNLGFIFCNILPY